MPGKDLKQAVHAVHELRLFCKEKWAEIPPSQYAGLINSYWKHLVEVIVAMGVTPVTVRRFTYFIHTQIRNIIFLNNKGFCLICLIGFSLSSFRTRVKI